MEEGLQKRHILPIAVLALAGAVLLGGALLIARTQSAQRARVAVDEATATLPFPTVRAFTATVRPTLTAVPEPTGTATTTPTATWTPTHTPTPTPTPRVTITEIRSLGRLETAQFLLQTVIDLSDEPSSFWEQLLGSDTLLLVAGGQVVAGFDLSKMQPDDISAHGDRVTIVLPPPEILYSRLDNEETFVYERKTGLLRQPDKDLEGEARRLAEQAMVERAQKGAILRYAETNGRLQVEALLRSLGFTDVIVIVRGG